MVAGLEVASSLWDTLGVLAVFGAACAGWWGAYKLSNFASAGGFLVLGLWLLPLLGALLEFRYVNRAFFWISSGMMVLLLALAVARQPKPESRERPG